MSEDWSVAGPGGYTVTKRTDAWQNDLVWVDGDRDGRLTLPLTDASEEPAGPFDSIRLANAVLDADLNLGTPGLVRPLHTVGDVVDAGGWELLKELFYSGEPASEASTGRVMVSINTTIPGAALYLNTTKAVDLDGDGVARFDEGGTGFREITMLPAGKSSASSPMVMGDDPSRDRRYPYGIKPQLNASFTLAPGDGSFSDQLLLQAGWSQDYAGTLRFEAWAYDLQTSTDDEDDRVTDVRAYWARPLLWQTSPPDAAWQADVSLTPVWSDVNGNGIPDLLLGNWVWQDLSQSTASYQPVEPVPLLDVAKAERHELSELRALVPPTSDSQSAPYSPTLEPPQVAVEVLQAGSEDSGTQASLFRIQRQGSLSNTLKIPYRIFGTATPNIDYALPEGSSIDEHSAHGVVVLQPGESSVTLTLPTLVDSFVDAGESIQIWLQPPADGGYSITPGGQIAGLILGAENVQALDSLPQPPNLSTGSSSYYNVVALALQRDDGSIAVWGDTNRGGKPGDIDLDGPSNDLTVQQLVSSRSAYAALLSDGSVVSWGETSTGGNSATLNFRGQDKQQHAVELVAEDDRIYALLSDGTRHLVI